jgi:hypothetical protein
MVLVVILNAVLAVLIVSAIVALHVVAILGGRRRGRATPVRVRRVSPEAPRPVRPQPRPTSPKTSELDRVPV